MIECDTITALLAVNLWVWFFLGVGCGLVLWSAVAWAGSKQIDRMMKFPNAKDAGP